MASGHRRVPPAKGRGRGLLMSLYVFDTDMLSLYHHGHPVVIQNVVLHLSAGLALMVITIEEQLSGWYTLLRRAKTHAQTVDAYGRLPIAANAVQVIDKTPDGTL